MVYSTSAGSVGAAVGLADSTKSAASSGILQKNGGYIGCGLSILWICISLFSIYIIKSINKNEVPNKNYYWIVPIVGLLLVLIANGYYFGSKSKSKNKEELNKINLVYANITLIPIYLIIITLVILIAINSF